MVYWSNRFYLWSLDMIYLTILSIGLFALWLYKLSPFYGRLIVSATKCESRFIGLLGLLSVFGLSLVLLYFLFGIHLLTITIALLLTSAPVLLSKRYFHKLKNEEKKVSWSMESKLYLAISLLGNTWLILLFLLNRYDGALTSPWLVLPSSIFVIYFITTLALLFFLRSRPHKTSVFVIVYHFFITFSVASIVYANGFGFDPFVHRAAQDVIFLDGALTNPSLLYSGQYALIPALAKLLALPLKLIDIWLVPLLASVLIPFAAYYGLGAKKERKLFLLVIPLLLLIPYLHFIFTVPYHISVLLFVIVLLLLPRYKEGRMIWLISMMSLLALFMHPLLGVPMIILSLILIGLKYLEKKYHGVIYALGFLGFAFGLPLAFAFYNLSIGENAFANLNPFLNIEIFYSLFMDPYAIPGLSAPLFWEILYWYPHYFVYILFISAFLIGYWFSKKEAKLKEYWKILISLVVGLGIAIFLISTLFVFKDIIEFEQSEFALRLASIWVFIPLPFALIWLSKQKWVHHPLLLIIFAGALTISFYMSYPQTNPKAVLSGESVSSADIEAVQFIEKTAEKDHFVLSNQMTAAAALQELGFALYLDKMGKNVLWYPLPTGGELNQFYTEMTYELPRREVMAQAAAFTKTDLGYFLVYEYWPGAKVLKDAASKEADAIYEIDEGVITIFEYRLD